MGTEESIEATCPDCRGPLSVVRTDSIVEFRCLVGHAYSPKTLLAAHADTQERALWSAVVSLREATNIVEAMADRLPPEVLERLLSQVKKKQAQAAILEQVLRDLEAFDL